jgi:hypothetical protein
MRKRAVGQSTTWARLSLRVDGRSDPRIRTPADHCSPSVGAVRLGAHLPNAPSAKVRLTSVGPRDTRAAQLEAVSRASLAVKVSRFKQDKTPRYLLRSHGHSKESAAGNGLGRLRPNRWPTSVSAKPQPWNQTAQSSLLPGLIRTRVRMGRPSTWLSHSRRPHRRTSRIRPRGSGTRRCRLTSLRCSGSRRGLRSSAMPLSASARIGHPVVTLILERTVVVTPPLRRTKTSSRVWHADLTILAKLPCALNRLRPIPLARA